MKKFTLFLLILYLIIPVSVFAYSDYVIASVHYVKKNGEYLSIDESAEDLKSFARDFYQGDIYGLLSNDEVTITYERNDKEYQSTIKLHKEGNEYKTGLYIKDTIRGVATLTYIDVDNKTFGALGHEIIEKSTKSKFDMTTGSIYKSTVTSITRSEDGNPGEKNAQSDSSSIYGDVFENTTSGIFGAYTDDIPNAKMYKVATSDEIKLGEASILTVIDGNNVEEFDINIIKINENSNTKNILFEVTDEELLNKTGGIVQGMSGSPIIQGDNIIGAVNYVLVDKTDKGYGIFITNMLEEAEN